MDDKASMAGVRPGAPNTVTDIKMLICYILKVVDKPLTFDLLYEALNYEDLVNYFELKTCMEDLVKNKHLTNKNEVYALTSAGEYAGKELKTSIPISTRERAEKAVFLTIARKERESQVNVDIIELKDGTYKMDLSIPHAQSILVQFSIHAPSYKECEKIRKRFLNAPTYIYKSVLAALIGDNTILDEKYPEKKNLLY